VALFGRERVERYRETDGQEGHEWRATTALLLKARTSTARGEERDRLWKLMTAAWPAYDDYQTKTDRQIPVVVLTKT
jgi:hypothetical protein